MEYTAFFRLSHPLSPLLGEAWVFKPFTNLYKHTLKGVERWKYDGSETC
jgi:hypothetical protein